MISYFLSPAAYPLGVPELLLDNGFMNLICSVCASDYQNNESTCRLTFGPEHRAGFQVPYLPKLKKVVFFLNLQKVLYNDLPYGRKPHCAQQLPTKHTLQAFVNGRQAFYQQPCNIHLQFDQYRYQTENWHECTNLYNPFQQRVYKFQHPTTSVQICTTLTMSREYKVNIQL